MHPRAEQLIRDLELQPHPKDGHYGRHFSLLKDSPALAAAIVREHPAVAQFV